MMPTMGNLTLVVGVLSYEGQLNSPRPPTAMAPGLGGVRSGRARRPSTISRDRCSCLSVGEGSSTG